MITQAQCKSYADDYQRLGRTADISIQRATILLAISRSWTTLAGQLGRLGDIDGGREAKESEEKPN